MWGGWKTKIVYGNYLVGKRRARSRGGVEGMKGRIIVGVIERERRQ